jgi:ribosomal protein S18 acetylase RimI-like enzyme
VGCARLVADANLPDARYIESVWVHPDFRRRGIVRTMVGRLEELAQEAGAQELRVWVLDTNSAAWDAYLKLGFADEGTTAPVRHPAKGVVMQEWQMHKPLFAEQRAEASPPWQSRSAS